MSFAVGRIGAVVAVLAGALALVGSAAAHPPTQHVDQRIDYTTAVQDMQAMLAMPGLGGLEQRAVSAGCTGQGDQAGTAGPYPCRNVDLESFVALPALGGATGNDIWGWTDPQTGSEYAIMGTSTSTGFVDVTDPKNPVLVGILPTAASPAPDFVLWRDIKVYKNHAFIVSEISGSGMQVFDLTRLRDETGVFTEDAFYDKVSNTHNISINTQSGFAYLVGNTDSFPGSATTDAEPCETDGSNDADVEGGGLHMVDIRDPLNPTFAGCAINDGVDPVDPSESNNYAHDVECVIYDGPDADYQSREICFGSNENAVVIYDVTDKANPVVLSQTTYPTVAYTHQGSLTEDRKYFLFGDELDELDGTVDNTTSYITPVSDLDAPGEPKPFFQETNSIDHNMYVHSNRVFQSNYAAGLRILGFDDASLANGELVEQGFFDVVPGADPAEFAGTWSNYRFPDSGITVVSTIENEANGLFVLKPTGTAVPSGDTPLPPASSTPTTPPGAPGGQPGSTGGTGTGGADGGSGGGETGDTSGGPCSNVIAGTKGSEKLNGTSGSDKLAGRGGRDRLKGGRGNDCLRGGGGKDRLNGGDGADEIKPGRGKDRIKGGDGDDEIRAARGGRDRVNCGRGDDVAFVNDRKDRVSRNCERVKAR